MYQKKINTKSEAEVNRRKKPMELLF